MIALTIVIAIVAVLLIYYMRKYLAYRKFFHDLPGESSFSYLYGNLHKYPGPNEAGMAYDLEMSKRTKYFHRVWFGSLTPVILAYHPESIRQILKSTSVSAAKPRGTIIASVYDMVFGWLGEGLLISNGARWARSRRLLTPAFHFNILKVYMNTYNSCCKILVSQLRKLSEKGTSFDLFKPINGCALDIILQCAFSFKSGCQTDGDSEYILALLELCRLVVERSLNPFAYNEFIFGLTAAGRRYHKLCDLVHGVAENIISKRRQELEDEEEKQKVSSKKTKDFLDILLMARDEDGSGLSPLEIRNEVDTFLFEGNDTTTSGISWTLYCLSQYPEYQERVYQEVVGVMGDSDEVTMENFSELEFTTMCIKEALRLHSTVPYIERELDKDIDIVGHKIPAGTSVGIQISMLHHNPHLWNEPNTFDPERFHPEKQRLMDPFQFIPFSAGPRNCIGQNFAMDEMKVTVAQVIKNFKLTADSSVTPRRFLALTMKTENGAMVFASPRDGH